MDAISHHRDRYVNKDRYNVLCLSGGGYRGLFTATLLAQLESDPLYKINAIRDHFDLIIGTSTGSLIAAGLSLGIPAEKIRKAFLDHGSEIFKKPNALLSMWRSFMCSPQYDNGGIKAAVTELLGADVANKRLSQIDAKLGIVAVSEIYWQHRILGTGRFAEPNTKATLLDAILGSTAAPTYFRPHEVANFDRYVDGGLAANAPVLLGASLLNATFNAPVRQIYVLHVGTAAATGGNSFGADRRSPINRYRQIILATLACQEYQSIELATRLFENRYLRIDADQRDDRELAQMDNTSEKVSAKLQSLASEKWRSVRNEASLRYFFA